MIVELRQYTLVPGRRDELIELFEREFVTGQEAAGITVLGRFRDLGDPDRFVWMRGFPDMAARASALAAFYDGPVWHRHRDAANATMLAWDDVLLLRPDGEVPPPVAGPWQLTICLGAEPFGAAFADLPGVSFRTEYAANTYPALPIREGVHAYVRLARPNPVEQAPAAGDRQPPAGERRLAAGSASGEWWRGPALLAVPKIVNLETV